MKKILLILSTLICLSCFTGCTGPNIKEIRGRAIDTNTISAGGTEYKVNTKLMINETYVISVYTFGTDTSDDDIIIECIDLELYELSKMK